MSRYRLGVDVGGTFTDLAAVDPSSGELTVLKVPTTPASPAVALFDGIDILARRNGIDFESIEWFVHGTTLALNTIIERKGARVGLIVTRGFPDVLMLRRLRLDNPSNLYSEVPAPLLPRADVAEVTERVRADGSIETALNVDEVLAAASHLVDRGVQAIVVSFLHSYRENKHEQLANEMIAERYPALYVCTSSEIWSQQREYERTLLSVMNAYVGRRMRSYFGDLVRGLEKRNLGAPVFSTRSNGGILTAASAGDLPVATLLSGPAAGAIGAMYIARQAGFEQVVTLDMGGTSADVSVMDGQPAYSTENRIGDFPVIMPAIDISSIGAGGGSIAHVDRYGVLKVGPESAGADPGPACYGRGGTRPTVTDAYTVLGIIDPDRFLGGEMKLDRASAVDAIGQLAEAMDISVFDAATAVVDVATANMEAELLPLMARHGVDATHFTLLPFGGAGPTHGFLLARQLGMRRVMVPTHPGALSAIGCLVADLRADFVRTLYRKLDEIEVGALQETFDELANQAHVWLDEQRSSPGEISITMSADMRYVGQSFEIDVRLPLCDGRIDYVEIPTAFHNAYEQVYFHSDPAAPVEIVNARLQIAGETPKPQLRIGPSSKVGVADRTRRSIYIDGEQRNVDVFQRSGLSTGQQTDGPCVVEQYDTTVFVPKGFSIRVDEFGNLIGEAR